MAATFPDVLQRQLQGAPSRPLVTFYDDATGERVELSVTTYANWVAKTANLLQEELDVGHGQDVVLDLRAHWLGTVWLGAVWSVGAVAHSTAGRDLDDRGSADPAVIVCGPDDVARHAGGGTPVVGLSLRPMAARFLDPLPDGVLDYSAVVWGQPDEFWPDEPVQAEDLAWSEPPETRTQAELVAAAEGSTLNDPAVRLLTDANPISKIGVQALLAPLLAGSGTVWVRNPDPAAWAHRAEVERATRELRLGAQAPKS